MCGSALAFISRCFLCRCVSCHVNWSALPLGKYEFKWRRRGAMRRLAGIRLRHWFWLRFWLRFWFLGHQSEVAPLRGKWGKLVATVLCEAVSFPVWLQLKIAHDRTKTGLAWTRLEWIALDGMEWPGKMKCISLGWLALATWIPIPISQFPIKWISFERVLLLGHRNLGESNTGHGSLTHLE